MPAQMHTSKQYTIWDSLAYYFERRSTIIWDANFNHAFNSGQIVCKLGCSQ